MVAVVVSPVVKEILRLGALVHVNIVNTPEHRPYKFARQYSRGAQPVNFDYKTGDAKKLHIGFIAEDVPELVASTDRKGVSFSDVVAILRQVVKDQQKTIKTLVEKSHMLNCCDRAGC